MLLKKQYRFNGIYDIVNAILLIYSPKYSIHYYIFNDIDYCSKKYIAYWVLTYGFMRLVGNKKSIILSYLIESIIYSIEYKNNHIHSYPTLISIIFCLCYSLLLSRL